MPLWAFLVAHLVKICPQCRRLWFDSWARKIPWRRDRLPTPVFLDFLGGSDSKESTCNVEDLGLTLGLGRSPWGGHGNQLQYYCLENPHCQRSLASYGPWGYRVRHSWAIKPGTQHNMPLCVCVYIYIACLLYPFICWQHLGCFHILADVNSAAMNIRVHISYWIMVFFVQPLWRTVWSFLKKGKIQLLCDPTIPFLGIYPENPDLKIMFI